MDPEAIFLSPQTTKISFSSLSINLPLHWVEMDWQDPLRNFAPRVTHPAPESVASSELSSVFGSDEEWYETRTVLLQTLKNDYKPNGPKDDTAKVLRTFAMKLPKEGQLALVSEIHLLQGDSAKLRQLRNFLVDTILKPSMLASCCSLNIVSN